MFSDFHFVQNDMNERFSVFFKLLVCFHNAGNQFVPYNVLLVEFDETDSFHAFQNFSACINPEVCEDGKSICVMSPVTIILVFIPIRVRNILICWVVVF